MMLVISATMEVLDYYDSAKYCDIVAATCSGYTKLLAKINQGYIGPTKWARERAFPYYSHNTTAKSKHGGHLFLVSTFSVDSYALSPSSQEIR